MLIRFNLTGSLDSKKESSSSPYMGVNLRINMISNSTFIMVLAENISIEYGSVIRESAYLKEIIVQLNKIKSYHCNRREGND